MSTTLSPERVASGTFLVRATEPDEIFIPEEFDEESRMLAASVEDFVRERVLPRYAAIEAQEEGVLEGLVREAGELGVFALDVPEELGGLGAHKTTAMLVAEKIGIGGSFSPATAVQTGIGGLPILYYGTDEQRERYTDAILTGELLTAYGLTEAGSGSDALGARTTAVLDEEAGVYRLNGGKQFITNAGFADLFIVFAKVDGEHFTAFIVPRDAEGFTVGPEEKKMGLKGSSTCALSFDDTPVPVENVLGEIGKGHRIAFNVLNIGRLKLSPAVLGGAKVSLADGARYAQERHQFEAPLASFPLIQQKLAGACARIYAHETLAYRTAHEVERYMEAMMAAEGMGTIEATVAALKELTVECSINKVYAAEAIDWVVDEMLQLHGGYGFIAEYDAERHYRDARINRIWEGTSEINRMLITGQLLDRGLKGGLPLMGAAKEVSKAAKKGEPLPEASGPWGEEEAAVEQARRLTLFAAGRAAKKHMLKIKQEQEVLSWLADMVIQTYTLESVLLRAQKAEGMVDQAGVEARRSAVRLLVEAGMEVVEGAGRNVLRASADGRKLEKLLEQHRHLAKRTPFEVRAEGRKLAEAVLEAEGYPFGV